MSQILITIFTFLSLTLSFFPHFVSSKDQIGFNQENSNENYEYYFVSYSFVPSSIGSLLDSISQLFDQSVTFEEPKENKELVEIMNKPLNKEEDSSFFSFDSLPSFQIYYFSYGIEEEPFESNDMDLTSKDLIQLPSLVMKQDPLYLNCKTCLGLIKSVYELVYVEHRLTPEELYELFPSTCARFGWSPSYCNLILYEVLPEMFAWLNDGNNPTDFCDCGEEGGSSGHSSGSTTGWDGQTGSDDFTNEDDSEKQLVHSLVVALSISGAIVSLFVTVRLCVYLRTRNNPDSEQELLMEYDDEESGNAPLPSYSELQSFDSADPPKYAFSAQDEATSYPHNPYGSEEPQSEVPSIPIPPPYPTTVPTTTDTTQKRAELNI